MGIGLFPFFSFFSPTTTLTTIAKLPLVPHSGRVSVRVPVHTCVRIFQRSVCVYMVHDTSNVCDNYLLYCRVNSTFVAQTTMSTRKRPNIAVVLETLTSQCSRCVSFDIVNRLRSTFFRLYPLFVCNPRARWPIAKTCVQTITCCSVPVFDLVEPQ